MEGSEPGDRMEGHDTSAISTVVAAAAAGSDDGPANKPNGPIDSAAKKQAEMDTSHHEDRCFACRDGGVLICCDHCDRVWHPACHKPMVLNVYDLQGRLVKSIDGGLQGAGRQEVGWDGTREDGNNTVPGMYVIEISLISELKTFQIFKPIGVGY